MTETAAAPPSPWFDVAKAAIPYIGQVLLVIVTFATGWYANTHLTKRPELTAADKPRPTPIVSLSDVDRSLEIHCGEIKGELETIRSRLPAPPKGKLLAPSR